METSGHTMEVYQTLASIVNYSDDAIITKTLDGIITSWNRGAENMFGYRADETIGKHISLIIPDDRQDEEPRIIKKIKEGEVIDHFETERVCKDGKIIHISLVISATKDASGKIIGILKIARDITFRKRTEEVQARMADIINLSDDAIYSKTLDGTITSWNKGAERIYGYVATEVIGKNVSMLIPKGRTDESPQIIRRVSSGESIDHYETERIRKDKSVIQISLSVSPVKDSFSRVRGVLIVARDITLQKRASELQAWLASIINFSDDAIISKTLEGIITSWNKGAQKIFGYAADEVIGKHISILIPPGRHDEEPEIIDKVSSGESIDHYRTERVRKDGTIVHISLTVSPIKDMTGKVVGVSKIARDMSEQLKSEEEIRILNQGLEAFNYSVAHDLKAPLRTVLGFTQLLLERYGDHLPDEGRELIMRIVRKANRMNALIRDLLSLSQSGRQRMDTSEVNVNLLVKDVIEELTAAGNDHLDITFADLHPISGDYSLLKQVWENLISNAVKYAKKEDRVRIVIGSYVTDTDIVYVVEDNGVGFDMSQAGNLFKAFERLHNNTEIEGTGIGLAIVRQIISRHGGRIWAESKLNEGSTFYFALPKRPSE